MEALILQRLEMLDKKNRNKLKYNLTKMLLLKLLNQNLMGEKVFKN